VLLPGLPNGIEYGFSILHLGVDFPAQLAGERHAHQLAPPAAHLHRLMRQPRQRQVGIAHLRQDLPRLGPGEDLAGKRLGHVLQRNLRLLRQVILQPLEIVPLGDGRRDEEKEVFVQRHHRHLRDDPALLVGEVGEPDPPRLRHSAGNQRGKPRPRAFALQPEARKAGKVEYARPIPYRVALLADAREPRPLAVERLRGGLRHIVARLRIPVGALPAIIGAELRPQCGDLVVDRRVFPVAPGGPGMAWKVDRIFVAVDFHALRHGIVGRGRKGCEAARVA
jgi:hypothetical protein